MYRRILPFYGILYLALVVSRERRYVVLLLVLFVALQTAEPLEGATARALAPDRGVNRYPNYLLFLTPLDSLFVLVGILDTHANVLVIPGQHGEFQH